jgi:hypothetical protein
MKTFYSCLAFLFVFSTAQAQFSLDIETGLAFQGYNEVRIPNDRGTFFDFNREFDLQGPVIPFRIRIGYTFAERNHIFALYAPLGLRYEGNAPREITFQNSVFPSGTPIDGFYQFNSYRLTYRRDLVRSENWIVGVGFTAKIRDAVVRLQDENVYDFKDDVGFVPLLHLFTEYRMPRWSVYLEGDGLAGGPGRAFDVFLGGKLPLTDKLGLKAGYRVLEGGADIDEVYNFTIVHFAVVGVVWGL